MGIISGSGYARHFFWGCSLSQLGLVFLTHVLACLPFPQPGAQREQTTWWQRGCGPGLVQVTTPKLTRPGPVTRNPSCARAAPQSGFEDDLR